MKDRISHRCHHVRLSLKDVCPSYPKDSRIAASMSYLGQPHSCLPSHSSPRANLVASQLFSSSESEPPWRDSNPCLTWAISKGMMLYWLSYGWLSAEASINTYVMLFILSKHILSCIHYLLLNWQEVYMLPNYNAYLFPTYPELNMSGPRDSLYIEKS